MNRIAYVSGSLGAGKSSLAAPLTAELGYSLVTKDLIKETLHDALYVPGDGEIDRACHRSRRARDHERPERDLLPTLLRCAFPWCAGAWSRWPVAGTGIA